MRIGRAVLTLSLALAGCSCWIAPAALAGPREAVAAATARWTDPAAIREYFVAAFGLLPDLAVTFGEHWIRVHGDAAVNTGYYTFSYRKEGATKTLAERYASRS